LDLYEYQGKKLFREYGVETLEGVVAASRASSGEAARRPNSSAARWR